MSLSSQRDASPPPAHASSAASTSQTQSQSQSQSQLAASGPLSSPPTTVTSSQPPANTTHTLPTPASSLAGTIPPSSHPTTRHSPDDDTPMTNAGDAAVVQAQGHVVDVMQIDGEEHHRTDHDRQAPVIKEEASPTTERIPGDGAVAREEKGPLYLLGKTAHPLSEPHPTQDLMSLYKLQDLAASVARHDPLTGEKRAIRKTYKGKIKSFGLAGRDKEVKHPEGQPGGLLEMAFWPAEEWYAQKVSGKNLDQGVGEDTLARLERAMAMEAGPLPGFDASILGLDAPAATPGVAELMKPPQQGTTDPRPSGPQPNGTAPRASLESGAGDPARPRRVSKKRRYDEPSFEGYGEGFVDDDADLGAGYSTSDREDKRSTTSGKKKRKKNSDSYVGVTSPGLERGGSYG
ncbi:MAG: hypothetical protein M1838_003416, partial [Thelocarpon superellum]